MSDCSVKSQLCPAYQNILKSALVIDCLVSEAAGLFQVVVAFRMAQPKHLCNKTKIHMLFYHI